MQYKSISFEKISQFSKRDKAYQRGDAKLQEFIEFKFDESEKERLIEARKSSPVDRSILVEEIKNQYKDTPYSTDVSELCDRLQNENCFTVTTAHQPSLLMGPLYYIYKICSAIHIASKWSTKEIDVLPIFIIGGEDHDLDEVDHFYLFNKEVKWDREKEGATGRMSIEGLDEVIDQTAQILGDNEWAEDLKEKMAFAQSQSKNYGQFMFHFINQIFQNQSLIVLSFDNKAFKSAFKPIIKKEILTSFSKPLVTDTQEKLEEKGFGRQAFARDINLFYLNINGRNRIEKVSDQYKILDTDISFSENEILKEIEENPENFSPNVIMRPLLQEFILPNLAYIGGGGELAYWLERKSQFKEADIFYPMLIRRKSAMWLGSGVIKSMGKLELNFNDLLIDNDALVKNFALNNSEHTVEFDDQFKAIENIYSDIKTKAEKIDASLVGKLEAMKTNHVNAIEKIQTRLVRAIKQKHEVQTNKILKIKNQLFPGNGLQERKTNFMEFYLKHGPIMIDNLIENCDPFDKTMLLVFED